MSNNIFRIAMSIIGMSFLTLSLDAQIPTYGVKLDWTEAGCGLDTAYCTISVRSTGADNFNLAHQNYRISFDRGLANPFIEEELTISGTIGGSMYSSHTITGSVDTFLTYNVLLTGGTGYSVGSDWVEVGKVGFEVVDTSECISFMWHTQSDFPATFVSYFDGTTFPPADEDQYLIPSDLCLDHCSLMCSNDTIFTDVIYLIDNSGSIDDTEYSQFESLITTSIADLQSDCADAQVAVLHYGGFEGKGLAIEYPFSTGPITSVNRQFCLTRSGTFNLCTDGGGDDLNHAIGSIIDSLDAGSLVHDTNNNLAIVILTDAFGFDTNCTQPFCSLILPTTNIDLLKSNYGIDVSVVGMSTQAEETALAIYASPGGTYNGGLNNAACTTSFDGCALPRKYLEVEFNSDPNVVAAQITSFVTCSVMVNTGLTAEAGTDQTICSDLSQNIILTATPSNGVPNYNYIWSSGAGTTQTVSVSPTITTTYYVTITDGNTCTAVDSVTVIAAPCCDSFSVDAGIDTIICSSGSASANLMGVAAGGVSPLAYSWNNGLGIGANQTASPDTTTIYTVTATDSLGCSSTDEVIVSVQMCCTGFSVSAGVDRTICSDFSETTTLTTVITGGVGPYLTVWDNGIGVMTNPIVSPSVTTTYNVTITDGSGCITTDDVIVTVDPMCGPDCIPDTTFTDVIFLIDNSGSIDDTEFAAFENIIMASLGGIRNSCTSSRRSVVHYGGVNGTSTVIEYALGQTPEITTINRQYCNARTGPDLDLCVGGGGDDLNNAIGDIISFLDDGSLNRDIGNKLSLVILTDAFGFDTNCPQPNCSLILPTTNIDIMKADHDVDVSVVGLSSQAEEVLLGIYASPGGSFNSPLYAPECAGSFDGCILPRKYVQIEFSTPPQSVADMITDFVSCEVEIIPALIVDAGMDQTICGNLGESATLTATGDVGVTPYTYTWSNGLGTSPSVVVSPTTTMKYFVTVTDANLCTAVDSVTINAQECLTCGAYAGIPLDPNEICLEGGQALLSTESNNGVALPMSFEEVFILTNEDLVIIDYSIGHRNFRVNETGLYRIHTLVAEVSNPASPDYLDLSIIIPGTSDLFLIVNCIENHNICADFDFKGRAHFVFGPEDMMCMTFENSINLCMDGVDNDGDGLIDCADDDCTALINCTENTLIACNDLTDNDGDGLVDCYDPDCFAFTVCFERGANCNDGIDNDGDGLIDCEDSSCDGAIACVENSPFTCKDGRDNDGDGLVDCADPDCATFIVCAESTDTACKDGLDNDYDGLVDCKDTDCKNLLPEYCEPFENTVEKCSDGRDNDYDGLVDCEDPDCITTELIAVLDNLEIILEVTDATCEGGDNGIIRFYGIAQDPSFQYSIDGGQNFISSYQFTALAPKAYVVAIKSALGCVHYLDINVDRETCKEICNDGLDNDEDGLVDCDDNDCNIVDPAGPQIINIQASDCPNYTNGSFEVSGLSSEVEYTIDGGATYQSSKIFTGLGAISYNLGFRDADGCHHGIIVTIPKGSDADDDNICDNVDVCPGVDDWIIGTPCDDLDPCTVDDIFNSVCDCAGTFLDSDQDGICDLDDICPTADDSLIGTACDDGNPCSTGDVYNTACNCIGVVQDSDGDGICDAEDVCPSGDDTLIGTACDDGDSCTVNDVYNTACNCLGTATDADFDNVCDSDDVCPGMDDSLIGTACDDGDPCTTGDIFTTACNCAGIYQDSDQDGVCDANDGCPSGDDSLIGTACDDGDVCTINDVYDTACNCVGIVQDSDGDGACDANDECPTLGMAIGSNCDDNNPATTADVVTANCECVGELSNSALEICDNGIDDDGDGMVDCEDGDCLNLLIIDFNVVGTNCDFPSGRIDVISPTIESFSFISQSNSGATYPVSYDSLPAGDYVLYAFSDCDTSIQNFVIDNIENCGINTVQEVCDNGIDDDGDGLIDCEDHDCNQNRQVSGSGCLTFNGQSDHVTLTSTLMDPVVASQEFTIEAWVNGEQSLQGALPRIFNNREMEDLTAGMFLSFRTRDPQAVIFVQYDGVNFVIGNPGTYDALDGNDHHIAATKKLDSLKIYVDGILIGARSLPTSNVIRASSEPSVIGYDRATGDHFNGVISDVRVWSSARTQKEIQDAMFGLDVTEHSTLLGRYRLNEGQGQIVYDEKANNNGYLGWAVDTEVNDPEWGAQCSQNNVCTEICDNGIDDDGDGLVDCLDGDCQDIDVFENLIVTNPSCLDSTGVLDLDTDLEGYQVEIRRINDEPINNGLVAYYNFENNVDDKTINQLHGRSEGAELYSDSLNNRNSAYRFDDDTDVLVIPNDDLLNITEEMSISVWIKLESTNLFGSRIIDKIISGTGTGYLLDIYDIDGTSSNQKSTVRFIGNEGFSNITNAEVELNEWTHIAVTYDRGLVKIYLNGIKESETMESATALLTNEEDLQIGNDLYGDGQGFHDPFDGSIDDVMIYNRVLDENEIEWLVQGANSSDTFNSENGRSNLSPGEYLIEVVNPNGCALDTLINIVQINCIEICDNGIDDDGDGLIDCLDNDCCSNANCINQSVTYSATDSDCNKNTGKITIFDSDPRYVYSITTLSESFDVDNDSLPPGDYFLNAFGNCDTTVIEITIGRVEGCETSDLGENENSNNGNTVDSNSVEICNNNIDDNGDGLIDCLDATCISDSTFDVTLTALFNASCPDFNNGAISGSGHSMGTMLSLDGINFQEDSTFWNLSAGLYNVTYRDENGCYEGDSIIVESECVESDIPETEGVTTSDLNIKVMLEGAYASDGLMSTELNDGGYLPGQQPATFFGTSTEEGQPFNQAPWFYEGTEGTKLPRSNSGETIYDPDVVDWILVSLRGEAAKSTEVWRGAGLLYYDGTIEFFTPLDLERTYGRGYYVVVEHRNHLPIMSANKVQLVDGSVNFDFTTQNSYTSILGVGQIQDEQGRYMMVAGNGELIIDLSSDIDINARDLTLWLQNNGANSSYFFEDYDMNGDINIKDRILWEKNNGLFTTFETKE